MNGEHPNSPTVPTTEGISAEAALPDVITVDGIRYKRIDWRADRLGAHLMYDCHVFRRGKGTTVRELVEDWRKEYNKPGDYGRPVLCPVIVLDGKKELRRVGTMVHEIYQDTPANRAKQQREIQEWIDACESDPDIPRLLASGRNCDE